MIVVDTSAVFAILAQESTKPVLIAKLESADKRCISLATRLECVMVASRLFPNPDMVMDTFLRITDITPVEVDLPHYEWAVRAFMVYGKGRHQARLSFGDCFSYAAAKVLNAPLLYVGQDFAKTDVTAA